MDGEKIFFKETFYDYYKRCGINTLNNVEIHIYLEKYWKRIKKNIDEMKLNFTTIINDGMVQGLIIYKIDKRVLHAKTLLYRDCETVLYSLILNVFKNTKFDKIIIQSHKDMIDYHNALIKSGFEETKYIHNHPFGDINSKYYTLILQDDVIFRLTIDEQNENDDSGDDEDQNSENNE